MRRAVVIGATEAAAFLVRRGLFRNEFTALVHIGPDPDPRARRAAIMAFAKFAEPCVNRGEDAAVEVKASTGMDGTQFCLVTLVQRGRRVVGAATYIIRCEGADAASSLLRRLQDVEEEWEQTGR